MCLFSASQDIATDALAVGLLEPKERGLGNAVQSVGGSLRGAIGGGGMLILLNNWGWRNSLLTLALIMIVTLIPVLLHRERVLSADLTRNVVNELSMGFTDNSSTTSATKSVTKQSSDSPLFISYFNTLINFCRLPGMGYWLLILLLYSASSSMAPTMFRPLLVDIGLSLSDIGWLLGIVGTIANMLGGIVAGLLIAPLGRKRSLIVFSSVWALTMMTYLLPAFGVTNLPVLYLVACAAFLTIGMMTTATFTIMMDKSTLESPGTDYTVQSSVGLLGSIGAAAISGVIAGAIGYRGVFAVSGAIAIISVLIIVKLFRSTERAVTSRDA